MRRLVILSGAIGIVFLVTCGGGGDEPIGQPATPPIPTGTSPAPPTLEPTRTAAPAIGRVVDADGDARVNGERANQNLKLRAADRIETKASSSIDFTLAGPQVECKTLANSRLELHPDTSIVIKWLSRSGVSYCSVERGQPPVDARFGLEPDVQLTVEGTIFGISESTLRVVEGFVTYRSGQTTQRLGPNHQVTFSASGQPGARGTWDGLADDESVLVGDLQDRRPAIALTPTPAERQSSKLLKAIEGQRAMIVLIDATARPEDEDFALAYFERLADAWFNIRSVQIQRATRPEASLILSQKAFAVYVAPPPAAAPTPRAGSATPTKTPAVTGTPVSSLAHDTVPFYLDGADRVWSVEFLADAAAKSAFVRFSMGILANGDYYDLFSPLFGAAPPYDRLLEVLK